MTVVDYTRNISWSKNSCKRENRDSQLSTNNFKCVWIRQITLKMVLFSYTLLQLLCLSVYEGNEAYNKHSGSERWRQLCAKKPNANASRKQRCRLISSRSSERACTVEYFQRANSKVPVFNLSDSAPSHLFVSCK